MFFSSSNDDFVAVLFEEEDPSEHLVGDLRQCLDELKRRVVRPYDEFRTSEVNLEVLHCP